MKMLDIKAKYKLISTFFCNRKMEIIWYNGIAAST